MRRIAPPTNTRTTGSLRRPTRSVFLSFAVAALASAQTADYVRDVRPILNKRCVACHGPAQQMNGLRLDDPESAIKGGYSGAAIIKGNSAASKMIERVASTKDGVKMPPAGPALTPAEVATLRNWIDQGANFPASAVSRSGAAKPKVTHWSFQPIRRPDAPAAKNAAWAKNPIDKFILARLEAEGTGPSAEASKTTLIRRVSLDLTGLPPTPRETEEFLNDTAPNAYERLVNRLLESPRFGERWARHWLDLAHYADSDGYEKDLQRPWAWRYRHWLIDALNGDLPFDQFTIEQLAGDLLPRPTTDQLVATGFLRNTLTNREAGVDRDEARFEQLVNRTNTVSTVFLGLATGCAQCHNHKYDPISQKDYYSMLAFFDQSEEQEIDAPLPGELGAYLAALPEWKKKREELLREYEIPALMPAWEEKMNEAIDKPGTQAEWDFALTGMKGAFDRAVKVLKTPLAKRSERDQRRLEDYFIRNGTAFGLPNQDKYKKRADLRKKLDELDKTLPPFSQASAMTLEADAKPTRLRIRGQWNQLGIEVQPDTIASLPAMQAKGNPTRLDLARWLVSKDHPLTPRVTVNRFWGELFGRGLVKTTEDFGIQGEKPTHPELLDWLAAEFMQPSDPAARPWSMKHILRTIVTSATYRQSSAARPELQQKDPENTLLARQSRLRLPAETLRDVTLASSGLLSDEIGGRSVKPPQPEGVAELGYGRSSNPWKAATGRDRYRRGLYIHFQRTTPYPMLMTFDAPDSSVACSRRSRSNTPLQALNLLNDEVFFEAAQALAWRLEREAPADVTGRLDYAYGLTLARTPSQSERDRLAKFHDQQARIFSDEKSALSPWVGVSRVLLNLDEFITRE